MSTPDRWVILTIRLAADDDGTVTATDNTSGCSATVQSTTDHGEAAALALYLLGRQIKGRHDAMAAGATIRPGRVYPHEQRRQERLARFYKEVPRDFCPVPQP